RAGNPVLLALAEVDEEGAVGLGDADAGEFDAVVARHQRTSGVARFWRIAFAVKCSAMRSASLMFEPKCSRTVFMLSSTTCAALPYARNIRRGSLRLPKLYPTRTGPGLNS